MSFRNSDGGIIQDILASANESLSANEHDHSEAASDLLLLAGIREECQECFSLIFYRYCNLVFNLAWNVLRNRSEAEDLVQEVFLAIFQQKYKYDPGRATVNVWICQFAHFKALVRRRSLSVRQTLPYEENLDFGEVVFSELRDLGDLNAWVFSVDKALSQIHDRQRKTIELVCFDGYTLKEAAQILSETLANTRNLYYRGMKSLRGLLQPLSVAEARDATPSTEKDNPMDKKPSYEEHRRRELSHHVEMAPFR